MRIFIALKPGKEFLESLLSGLSPLKEKYPHFRWIPKENLHVTLVFLGELDEGLVPQIKEATEASINCGEIDVLGGRLFTLPKRKPANVLALNFEKGGEEIAALSGEIKKSLKIYKIPADGSNNSGFLSHITLARKGKEPLELLKEDNSIFVHGVFSSLGVYQSVLLPHGACYNLLAAFPLASGAKINT